MSREIKFRAWLRDVGIMLQVYVLDQTGNAGRGTHFSRSKGYSEHGDQFVFNIDDAELMQFTGLHDKNGVPIYEGDIIRFKYYKVYKRWWSNQEQIPIIEEECNKQRSEVKEQITTVVYADGCYILKNGYPLTLVDVARGERFKIGQTNSCDTEEKQWDFEVIGNIYENPELIDTTGQ